MYSHWLCSPLLLSVSSLDCSDLGLKAEEGSVRPVTEELEVLKKLIGGLQDIKLIGEVRGEGGGRRTEPWCFNSQHLTVQQSDERFHLSDHLDQLGHCRVVVLLRHSVEPLKVVLVQLQVGMKL